MITNRHIQYIIAALALILVAGSAQAATYTVSNTNDSGAGSLRQAIIDSNTAGGANTINFTAPSGTIVLLTDLDTITNTVTFTSTTASAVTITAGSLGFSDPIKIDSDGDMSIGTGASMSGLETLSIGHIGTAELSIYSGGTVDSTLGSIGNLAGSSGTVTVDGAGSTWTNSDVLIVGDNGNGALNITGGGEVENTDGTIGGVATSTATVTVDGVGSTWTNNGDLYIGNDGTGTLDITGGGDVNNTSSEIGASAGSVGTVTVDGVGSIWTNSSVISIGFYGTGTLNITGGGLVSNATMGYIGSNTGSIGTVTVDGAGSTWTNTGDLRFGQNGGDGTLDITGGGSVTNDDAHIGYSAGSAGTTTVDGAGSMWTNAGALYVGDIGNGTLDITNGGVVTNTVCYIGNQADSIGTVTIDGPGSTWTNSGELIVGASGDGTLDIRNGGEVNNTRGDIAYEAGSVSSVTVDGAGSTWTNTGNLYVGIGGTGTLDITNGGVVSSVAGFIGYLTGDGTVTVDGPGSTWTNSIALIVGADGTGTLNITDGGKVSNRECYVGEAADSTGIVTVDGADSLWDNSSTLYVGYDGDGTLDITGGGEVDNTTGYIGYSAGSIGTVTVDGSGSTWINSNNLTIGYNGTGALNITGGGAVSNREAHIGYAAGSTGTATVDGIGSTWTSSEELVVGNGRTGTLNITNGGTVISVAGYIGAQMGITGTATVDGAGSMWTSSDLFFVGYGGNGTLTIKNGGLVNVNEGTDILYLSYSAFSQGTINIGSGAGTTSGTIDALNITGRLGTTGTINFNHDNPSAYIFSTPLLNNLKVEQKGPGTTILSGANTYTGGTIITAGILEAGSTSALGAGAVTNNATLNVGTIALDIGAGVYTQNVSGSQLRFTVDTPTTSGSITSTSAAVLTSDASMYMNIGTDVYVLSGTSFTVIDTGSAGIGAVPGSVTSNNGRLRFTPDGSSGNLILTTSRASIYFADLAANSNQAAVGAVLDGITNPTGDMATILSHMETLTPSQADSAMNSMLPDYSGALLQVSQATLNQLIDAILGHQSYLRSSHTGVSTGSDMFKGLDIWAQGYGSYLHQDPRELSQGYNASIWGTALGLDLPALNDLRIGTCFGFAQDYIRGKDNSNRTDVNAYQWTVYGEYSKDALYVDLSGAFALNTYDGSRQVNAGAGINRTASSDYNGEQYQIYAESGYTLGYKKLNITPLASFQYQHLHLDKYIETGAGALNLSVKAQDYDLAQTGLGIKLDYPLDTKYGTLLPELRVKWLYDWVGDAQATTSSFTGGGASFATQGFKPAQSSWDFGTKLTMFTNNNWTMSVNYDLEIKEDFYGHYGYGNAKYEF